MNVFSINDVEKLVNNKSTAYSLVRRLIKKDLSFNLPRLSVDIDLDFLKPVRKEEMLQQREMINNDILKYMESSGYSLNPRSKTTYSLDSKIFIT